MKKLTWHIFIAVCAVVLSFTGLYAATKSTPATSEKPAVEMPAAVEPSEPSPQPPAAAPLTLDDARAMVEGRLTFLGNRNLKMGAVTDQGESFEAEIVTRDGSLVDKLVLHKAMGWMRSIY